MSRVLLLNPPGTQNIIRDYFCSKLSKSHYISPPVTLLCLSGWVGQQHEVGVLDAIVEQQTPAQSLRRIAEWKPETVISLVGAVSWDEDRAFLAEVKRITGAAILAVGDVLLDDTEERLREAPALDAALLNFVTPDVLQLIPLPANKAPIPNVVYRIPGTTTYLHGGLRKLKGEYSLPLPRHELFPLRRYRFPFMLHHPLSAILTDYGCPYQCSFCVIPGLGFGLRPLGDLAEELVQLKRLGVRELFFLDQTFGVGRERTLQLCRLLQDPSLAFSWSCFSRADVLTPDLLRAMKRAGCHTIIFGVESGSDATLTQYHKRMNLQGIAETLALCRQTGIRVAATFMLGLPGEDEAAVRATVALALKLPLDFVSFNVAIPRAGTELRREAIAAGLIDASVRTMDQSGIQGAMSTRELSAARILALRREALKRFYLRPGYLLRRLFTLRSWRDFHAQVADGWGVVMDALGLRKGE